VKRRISPSRGIVHPITGYSPLAQNDTFLPGIAQRLNCWSKFGIEPVQFESSIQPLLPLKPLICPPRRLFKANRLFAKLARASPCVHAKPYAGRSVEAWSMFPRIGSRFLSMNLDTRSDTVVAQDSVPHDLTVEGDGLTCIYLTH